MQLYVTQSQGLAGIQVLGGVSYYFNQKYSLSSKNLSPETVNGLG